MIKWMNWLYVGVTILKCPASRSHFATKFVIVPVQWAVKKISFSDKHIISHETLSSEGLENFSPSMWFL